MAARQIGRPGDEEYEYELPDDDDGPKLTQLVARRAFMAGRSVPTASSKGGLVETSESKLDEMAVGDLQGHEDSDVPSVLDGETTGGVTREELRAADSTFRAQMHGPCATLDWLIYFRSESHTLLPSCMSCPFSRSTTPNSSDRNSC